MKQATLPRLMAAMAGSLILLAAPTAAVASPPDNDNFADASVISALPFTDSGDLNGTTTEPGEQSFCVFQPQTVWYAFTPSTTGVISVDTNGSQGPVVMTAYQSNGGGPGGLGFMSCIYSGSLVFTASAGTTYYFQVGSFFSGPMLLQFHVQEVPPPPNDAFADAKAVTALPYSDTADMTAATTEPGEPFPGGFPIAGSAWYAFTATESESLTASANVCCTAVTVAAYTGDSVANLTPVPSGGCCGTSTFKVVAGTTYYVQVGRGGGFGGPSPMSFRLDVAPPPVATLGWSPFDPSSFDSVNFYAYGSYDPVNVGIQTVTWNFGDGAADTGFSVFHRYAADRDYAVKLTVTTFDGRVGSATQVVHVKTHDVAITKFTAPNAASAGQTRQLSVSVNNSRYPETVQVQLLKSAPGSYGGFLPVGTLTQSVPVTPRNQSVPFAFSYTFTADDAAVGKVSFQAVATIVSARDAQSADNTAITLPTKVNR